MYYVYRSLSQLQSPLFFQHVRGEKECEQGRENYKQTETAREEEKETAVLREARANVLAFQTPNLRETARHRERAQTISANTNMGNGSKIEFTRARC